LNDGTDIESAYITFSVLTLYIINEAYYYYYFWFVYIYRSKHVMMKFERFNQILIMLNVINKKCLNVFEWKLNQLKYPKQKILKEDGKIRKYIFCFIHYYKSNFQRHKLQLDINSSRQKLQEQQQRNKKTESDLRKEKWRQETG
jgi:hypothetical protein